MSDRGEQPRVRLTVAPGDGRIARRRNCLLFVPAGEHLALADVIELFDRFVVDGATDAVRSVDHPRCIIEWGDIDEPIAIDTTFALRTMRLYRTERGTDDAVDLVPPGVWPLDPEVTAELWIFGGTAGDPGEISGDLRDGDVPAGGFGLTHPDVTTEPPQFDELADLDVTLAPIGPITYPEDDTDRTFRRSGDIRCPRGHANAKTNLVCRLCGDSLDSTASRSGPRASTAVAGLRLPDGSVIPINRTIVLGRSPSADAGRTVGSPRLVVIDGARTVSRTHVVVRVDVDGITVTDCDARGRTAVVTADHPLPIALTPWQPRAVSIGDTILLGGPTTLKITDPKELRVPPALERTARPIARPAATELERDETT